MNSGQTGATLYHVVPTCILKGVREGESDSEQVHEEDRDRDGLSAALGKVHVS